MSLVDPQFPSSHYFDKLASLLEDQEKRDAAIKDVGSIITFTLRTETPGGPSTDWYIDMKDDGRVGKGKAPNGREADQTFVCKGPYFEKLVLNLDNFQYYLSRAKLNLGTGGEGFRKLIPYLKDINGKVYKKEEDE